MKNVYLRSDCSIKKISTYILLSLIPLVLGGVYKHGIKLYTNDLVGFYGLLKPLIITLMGLFIGSLVNIIYERYIKKNKSALLDAVFSSFHPVYGILIASVVSINTNLILFMSVTAWVLFVSKFIKNINFNVTALAALLIILLMAIFDKFTFLNAYEASKVLNLNAIDYLVGMGSGGINTTYVIFLLVSLIILLEQSYYKRAIPLASGLVFMGLMFCYLLANGKLASILDNIFANGVLFSFIYVAPDSVASSYTRVGKIIFGSLIGIFTFGLYLIEPSLAALGAILIVSLLHSIIDKFCLR